MGTKEGNYVKRAFLMGLVVEAQSELSLQIAVAEAAR